MFKVINGGITPTRGSKYSAMVDLYAREDIIIGAGCTSIVNLGVKIDLEYFENKGFFKIVNFGGTYGALDSEFDEEAFNFFKSSHYLELHPRSSLRAKGLIIGVGICDLDYPDELGLIVHNPIVYIEEEIKFDKDDDYIEVPYYGVPNKKEHCGSKKFKINKGDKIAQCTLKEHKGYLLGIESDIERKGGYGSTDK